MVEIVSGSVGIGYFIFMAQDRADLSCAAKGDLKHKVESSRVRCSCSEVSGSRLVDVSLLFVCPRLKLLWMSSAGTSVKNATGGGVVLPQWLSSTAHVRAKLRALQ